MSPRAIAEGLVLTALGYVLGAVRLALGWAPPVHCASTTVRPVRHPLHAWDPRRGETLCGQREGVLATSVRTGAVDCPRCLAAVAQVEDAAEDHAGIRAREREQRCYRAAPGVLESERRGTVCGAWQDPGACASPGHEGECYTCGGTQGEHDRADPRGLAREVAAALDPLWPKTAARLREYARDGSGRMEELHGAVLRALPAPLRARVEALREPAPADRPEEPARHPDDARRRALIQRVRDEWAEREPGPYAGRDPEATAAPDAYPSPVDVEHDADEATARSSLHLAAETAHLAACGRHAGWPYVFTTSRDAFRAAPNACPWCRSALLSADLAEAGRRP